jgi:glutamate-1-semialdehyde 2,1-aminomutase
MTVDPAFVLRCARPRPSDVDAGVVCRFDPTLDKHRCLAGRSRLALRPLVRFYEYDENRFYAADGAPADLVARRRAGFEALAADLPRAFFRDRSARSTDAATD